MVAAVIASIDAGLCVAGFEAERLRSGFLLDAHQQEGAGPDRASRNAAFGCDCSLPALPRGR